MHKAGKINGIELPKYIFVTPPKEKLMNGANGHISQDDVGVKRRKKSIIRNAWQRFKDPGMGNEDKYNATLMDTVRNPVIRRYVMILFFVW